LLALETEGPQGAVVGAAAGDARAEEVRVGRQVGGCKRSVAMPADEQPLRIGNATFYKI